MKFKYDLHVHSVLSGCASRENTIQNILNMAKLCKIDILAITDHNAGFNAVAAQKAAAEKDILLIPGVEVSTSEDIHVLSYFRTFDALKKFCDYLYEHMPKMKFNTNLYFTQEILGLLAKKGVEIGYVTLNVGLGTFRPVKCENVLEHKMDSETFEIPQETAELINRAKAQGKKIVAVGTTTVRTLETAYKLYGEIKACHDASTLFIYPPYEFKVVDNLITNFHLPKSTLLMLVSALMGKDFIMRAYKEAIANKYRFYSYGECMLLKTR